MLKKYKNYIYVSFFLILFVAIYFGVNAELKNKFLYAQELINQPSGSINGKKSNVSEVFKNEKLVMATYKGDEIKLSDLENREFLEEMGKVYNFIENSIFQQVIKRESSNPSFLSQISALKVSDKDISKFYVQENLKSQGPLEQIREPIRNHLLDQKKREFVQSFIVQSLKSGNLVLNITKPKEITIVTGVEDSIISIEANSDIAVVEYSDFQCPFCRRVQDTIQKLNSEFPNVRFFYKHFPLNIHPEADEAAVASECAYQQGKFEQYKSVLFDNQNAQFEKNLLAYAKPIVPDYASFENCYRTQGLMDKVNKHIREGAQIGINGTPGFVIGKYDDVKKTVTGKLLNGALPFEAFRNEIMKYQIK